MESPLDPNNQISTIPQGYEHGILNEIINEEINKLADEIYQQSLNDPYHKVSDKFPDYNNPDSQDHKKAVDYVLNHMKEKHPNEDWDAIEKQVRNKISDGQT